MFLWLTESISETCLCERKANGLTCPFISLMWSMFKGLYVVLTKSKFTSRTLAFDLAVQITRYLEFQGEERIHMCIFPLCIFCGRLWVRSVLAVRWFTVAWEHCRWPCCLRLRGCPEFHIACVVLLLFLFTLSRLIRLHVILELSVLLDSFSESFSWMGSVECMGSSLFFFFLSFCSSFMLRIFQRWNLKIVFKYSFFFFFENYPFQSSRYKLKLPNFVCSFSTDNCLIIQTFIPRRNSPNNEVLSSCVLKGRRWNLAWFN